MLLINIKIRHIHCFLNVVLFKSLAKAADNLHISVPAVSRAINELEEMLNTKLFVRTPKGMELTNKGHVFLTHANKGILELNKGISTILKTDSQDDLQLKIGAPDHMLSSYLPEVIQNIKQFSSSVMIDVYQAQDALLYEKIKNNELSHIIVRFNNLLDTVGLSIIELFSEPISLVVNKDHPLTLTDNWDINLLQNFQLVLPPLDSHLYLEVRNYLYSRGIGNFSNYIESNSLSFVKQHVSRTTAIWFVPSHTVKSEINNGIFSELEIDTKQLQGRVVLVTPENKPISTTDQLFIQQCKEVAKQI